MKKVKMPNKPAMLYPTILVGADVNGKPNGYMGGFVYPFRTMNLFACGS